MSEENRQEVPERPDLPVKFRDDLRPPVVQWGRCSVTGEWALVVALDLGDISVEAPVVDKGVVYDPLTKDVTFTQWRPVRFEQQATFSAEGLKILLRSLEDSAVPLPSIAPVLVYMWKVLYSDGSAIAQFQFDPGTSAEVEQHSGVIDFSRVAQLSVIPRDMDDASLPTYTFVCETGKFYKGGQEILDIEYDGSYPAGVEPYYARKVTHTWGSVVNTTLAREVQGAATTVLQLLGWRTVGEDPVSVDAEGKCCIIAIDARGNWRPWKYIE